MSGQYSSEEFEQAYNHVFGKDRDLSELSDIDMDDFKEVMRKAVEQFDKTAPPEPEECHDIIYIFWRVYKTIHQMLQRFSKDKVLKLLEHESFYDLNDRSTIISAIRNEYSKPEVNFPSIGDVIELREKFDSNRIKLINCYNWLVLRGLYCLFIISIPLNLILNILLAIPYVLFRKLPSFFDQVRKSVHDISNMDISLYNEFETSISYHSIPVYNHKELGLLLVYIEKIWHKNKKHIVKTGYSKTLFLRMKWVRALFQSLYPTRKVFKMDFVQDGFYGDAIMSYYWKDSYSPSVPKYIGDYSIERQYSDKFVSMHKILQMPFRSRFRYDYQCAPFIDNMPRAIVFFSDFYRRLLHKTYYKIFNELSLALSLNNADLLVVRCIDILHKSLFKVYILFFMKFERVFSRWEVKEGDKDIQPAFGGITELFQFIGFIEKEIKSGYMNEFRNNLEELIEYDKLGKKKKKSQSYLDIIDKQSKKYKVDRAIRLFLENNDKESKEWEEYYYRINKMIKNKFKVKLLNVVLYSPRKELELQNTFKPYKEELRDGIWSRCVKDNLFPRKEVQEELKQDSAEEKERKPYFTPEGTIWDDITLTIKDDDSDIIEGKELYYKVVGKSRVKINLKKTIFYDHSTKGPSKRWKLLKLFAENKGKIPYILVPGQENIGVIKRGDPDSPEIIKIEGIKAKKGVLNSEFKRLFSTVEGDPIEQITEEEPDEKLKKREVKKYKTNFMINMVLKIFPGSISSWGELTLVEIDEESILITTNTETGSYNRQYGENTDISKVRMEKVYTVSKSYSDRLYELFTLGLANKNNTPNRIGKALKKVLRSRGKVQCEKFDNEMKNLRNYLCDFFELPESFDFTPFHYKEGKWIANFTARSNFSKPLR